MRRVISTVAISAALLLGTGGVAAAGNDYCGASANGCGNAFGNTICAGHGAFGAFGKDNNFAGGANGDLTGYFNSILCGSPQGAAGVIGQ